MSCLVPQTPTCLNHNEQLRYLGAKLGFGGSPGTLKSDGRPQSPDPRDPASQRWLHSGVQVLEAGSPPHRLYKPTQNPSRPRCAANAASQGPLGLISPGFLLPWPLSAFIPFISGPGTAGGARAIHQPPPFPGARCVRPQGQHGACWRHRAPCSRAVRGSRAV